MALISHTLSLCLSFFVFLFILWTFFFFFLKRPWKGSRVLRLPPSHPSVLCDSVQSRAHTHTDGVECVESPEVVTAAQEPLRLGTREIEVVLLTGKWLRRGDDLLPGS